VYML